MKIGFVIPSFLGGAPQSAMTLARKFHEDHHEVIIFCGQKDYPEDAVPAGLEVVSIPENYHVSMVKTFISAAGLMKRLCGEPVDVLFSNSHHCIDMVVLASSILNIPAVLCNSAGVGKDIQRLIRLSRFNWILYSQEQLQFLNILGKQGNFHLIPARFSFDITSYHDAVRSWDMQAKPRLVYLAQMRHDNSNGIKFLITRICDELNIKNIQFHFYGDGEARESLEGIAYTLKEKGIEVVFWGMRIPVMPDLISQPTIVIGKGRSVLEPAGYGVPAFVLSEDGGVFHISETTVAELAKTNFSGRDMTIVDDFGVLVKGISGLGSCWEELTKKAMYTSYIVRDRYDLGGAFEMVGWIFNQAICDQHQIGLGQRMATVMKIIWSAPSVIVKRILRRKNCN